MIRDQVIGLGGGRQDVPGRDEGRQEGVNDRPNEEGHIECLCAGLKRGGREETTRQGGTKQSRSLIVAQSRSGACQERVMDVYSRCGCVGSVDEWLGWVLGV